MPGNAWLAILIVVVFVIVVNLTLWFMWRGRGTHDQIQTLRQAAKTLRQPWRREDDSWKELSERVQALRKPDEPHEEK